MFMSKHFVLYDFVFVDLPSIVCEDSAINIYHSPSVICHILFGVNDVIIDCEISNNDVYVKHFVYMISYL